ncbi:hypothetical protein D3C80_1337170 [compost metagenome]
MVADTRQHRHDDLELAPGLDALALVDGVLGFQVQVHHIGQHAQHRFAGTFFEPVQAGLEQGDVTAKTVDDKTFDPRLLARREQFQGADQMGENPATVDVGNQDHRAIHRLGKTHVGDVAGPQVDLGRRAGTFNHHHRIGCAQALVRGQHSLHGDDLVVVIGHGIHAGDRAAMDDYLGPGVAVGLEQHRVHVCVRRQAGCLGLNRLGSADLATVGGHRTVERHVLRFERHHADTLTGDPAAQRGYQRTFTSVRGGALHHQRRHGFSLAKASNAAVRRAKSASSPGKPKRRLLL